jgi:hypothetical protein
VTSWIVYDEGGAHRGPFTTEALAVAVRAGEVPDDAPVAAEAWFAEPGTFGWRRLWSVPELARALLPARSSLPPPLQIVDGAFRRRLGGDPDFGDSVMVRPVRTTRTFKG